MGLIQYVGPIITFPTIMEKTEKTIFTCGEHDVHREDKFCCECGKEIVGKVIFEEYPLSIQDIIGYDHLMQKNEDGFTYLFTNHLNIGFYLDNFYKPTIISPEVMEGEIEKFKEKHKEHITSLEEHLKMEFVVQFGIIEMYG